MATAKTTTPDAATQPANFAELMSNVDRLAGNDLRDKGELVDVPFVITQVYFRVNDSGVSYACVTGINESNEVFDFIDSSSTGVRQQLIEYLHDVRGIQSVGMSDGVIHHVQLFAPRGLRVSEFEVNTNKGAGKPVIKFAKAYYITKGSR